MHRIYEHAMRPLEIWGGREVFSRDACSSYLIHEFTASHCVVPGLLVYTIQVPLLSSRCIYM